MIGTFVLSAGYYDAYYVKAQQVRALIRRDYDAGVRARRRRRGADEPDAARSGSASGPTIRCRCIWRTCSPSRRTSRGCRRSAFRAGLTSERAAGGTAVDGAAVRRGDAAARGRRDRSGGSLCDGRPAVDLTSSQTIAADATSGSSGIATTQPEHERQRGADDGEDRPDDRPSPAALTSHLSRNSGKKMRRMASFRRSATSANAKTQRAERQTGKQQQRQP